MQSFILNHIASSGYIAIFVLAFLSAMCLPIPSEVTFAIAGALCSASYVESVNATVSPLHLWKVIVVGVIATVCGALAAYLVGRFGGRAFVDRYGKYVLLSHEDLDTAEQRFNRWGDAVVAVGQCIPFIRAFMGFGSGVAKVRAPIFIALTLLGAAVWVTAISFIGYEASGSLNTFFRWFSGASYLIAAAVVIIIIIGVVHRWRRYHEATARRSAGG